MEINNTQNSNDNGDPQTRPISSDPNTEDQIPAPTIDEAEQITNDDWNIGVVSENVHTSNGTPANCDETVSKEPEQTTSHETVNETPVPESNDNVEITPHPKMTKKGLRMQLWNKKKEILRRNKEEGIDPRSDDSVPVPIRQKLGKIGTCIKVSLHKVDEKPFTNGEIKIVQNLVLEVYDKLKSNDVIPKIKAFREDSGTLAYYCVDSFTVSWLVKIVDNLPLGETKIVARYADQPANTRMVFRTKDVYTENPDVLLRRLSLSEPRLRTNIWKYISKSREPYATRWIFEIDTASMVVLKDVAYKVYTGLDEGEFKKIDPTDPDSLRVVKNSPPPAKRMKPTQKRKIRPVRRTRQVESTNEMVRIPVQRRKPVSVLAPPPVINPWVSNNIAPIGSSGIQGNVLVAPPGGSHQTTVHMAYPMDVDPSNGYQYNLKDSYHGRSVYSPEDSYVQFSNQYSNYSPGRVFNQSSHSRRDYPGGSGNYKPYSATSHNSNRRRSPDRAQPRSTFRSRNQNRKRKKQNNHI